jgi:extracellular factor (EF) 3-hydroxypalmitic acid methyl ester biosynthesis protein
MTNPTPQPAVNGAVHANLLGAVNKFRFRGDRLSCDELNYAPLCKINGVEYKIANLSSAGMGIESESPLSIKVGQIVEQIEVCHHGQLFWTGSIEVTSVNPGKTQAGFRLIAGHISMPELRFRDEFLEHRLGKYLDQRDEQAHLLPAGWQADVAQLHSMLCEVHTLLDDYEKSDYENQWRHSELSKKLCAATFEKWSPAFLEIATRLDENSLNFDAETKKQAENFSQTLLMRELIHGEVQRRAYEKPQGYAGDFRMMELTQADTLEGETLYARFLQYFSQEMSLGKTVCARGQVAFDAISDVAKLNRPVKIVSLASGPAMELRRFVKEAKVIEHKIDVFLVDQDEDALRNCLNALNKICAERGDNPPIEFHCLHFSLRQILAPKKGAERELVNGILTNVDLVYSMGLFDYLPQPLAQRTVKELFGLLASGGKLLIGNLVRVPDSSWLIEYASAWHLIYRDKAIMKDMGSELDVDVEVMSDETSHCLFLFAQKEY